MPFIGNQPTAVPLTSADITDGIISTAKIADNAVTTAKTSYSDAPYRNIIINGDMSIAQRGTSTASITSSGYYTVDRFQIFNTTLGTWTQSQDTDVPSGQGFAKSLKMACTTADTSPAAGDLLTFVQKVEGQNLQYLKKGTSSAESTTLSFWVKSNKTGTYIAELVDVDNSRQISKSYTISSANTWEKKTLTYAGDTTGAFDNDNARSLDIVFWLGAGSNFTSGTLSTSWSSITNANRVVGQVNLADSTSNYINITGVQLEAGTTASDFEFLPYDVNIQRCQRYFELIADGSSQTIGIASCFENGSTGIGHYYVTKRAVPTLYQTTGANYYSMYRAGTHNYSTQVYLAYASKYTADLYLTIGTTDQSYLFLATNASSKLALQAEL